MTDGPKFVPVAVEDRQWIAWSKEWPADLRDAAKAMVEKYRRVGAGDSDRARAYNAFLVYRALAPRDLGGPQYDGPSLPSIVSDQPVTDSDPDWSDL
jgi:hypothetical protein